MCNTKLFLLRKNLAVEGWGSLWLWGSSWEVGITLLAYFSFSYFIQRGHFLSHPMYRSYPTSFEFFSQGINLFMCGCLFSVSMKENKVMIFLLYSTYSTFLLAYLLPFLFKKMSYVQLSKLRKKKEEQCKN